MKKIPFVDNRTDLDCCTKMYRRAIWNCLLELKPKYALEFGSFIYQTSSVFSKYFCREEEGGLVTVDISEWNRNPIPPERVYPVMVYPHTLDIAERHSGLNIYYENWKEITSGDTYMVNGLLIHKKLREIGAHKDGVSFTFVDSDHLGEAFLKDLTLAKSITREDGFILIDDILEKHYSQYEVYQDLKKRNEFYEFEDWSEYQNEPVGMALIKCGDLQL